MPQHARTYAAPVTLLIGFLASGAQAQSITALAVEPGGRSTKATGISADGRTIIGTATTTAFDGDEAVVWRLDGSSTIVGRLSGERFMVPQAVSADGGRVVGYSMAYMRNRPWTWTQESGLVELPGLPGSTGGWVGSMSGDGRVILGSLKIGTHSQGVRWRDGAPELLSDLTGVAWSSLGHIAADGSAIVGTAHNIGYQDTHLARWTQTSGLQVLQTFPEPVALQVSVANPDTSTIFGNPGDRPHVVFRYSDGSGYEELPTLSDFNRLTPNATSADGSILVGTAVTSSSTAGFIWTTDTGTVLFSDWLAGFGVDLAGWEIHAVRGVTPDGFTFVGSGRDPSGDLRGFVATIPAPTTTLPLAAIGLLAARRRRAAC